MKVCNNLCIGIRAFPGVLGMGPCTVKLDEENPPDAGLAQHKLRRLPWLLKAQQCCAPAEKSVTNMI
jgi:hypothetical protein